MQKDKIINEINKLRKQRKAVIVAHNYQIDEVQDIADIVGDSLALSHYCAKAKEKLIIFCGVHFMAESAKILSPEKTVLLPQIDAGCPMADMVTPEALIEKKRKYPNAAVVCYINSSAAVKALSDICCTSSNAINIIASIREKQILFVPDQNLGAYVASQLKDKEFILWKGFCITHHRVSLEDVLKIKKTHPDAYILMHPECRPEVLKLADFIGSTKQIIDYVSNDSRKKYIIGTEMGVLNKLKRDNPNKTFYLMSQGLICPNMKKTTLDSIYNALKNNVYKIELDEDIRKRADNALKKMLAVK